MTVEAPLNAQGLHRVQCPSCQSHRVESFLKVATTEFDPNAKLCRLCGYAWKQIHPIADPVTDDERAFVLDLCDSQEAHGARYVMITTAAVRRLVNAS